MTEEKCKRLKKENEELKEKLKITETAFEMVQNTIGQAHIEGVNLARKNNKLKIALEEIRGICKCSKEMNCEECPQCDDCEELCTTDENLQDIVIDTINKVLESEEE